MCVGIHQNLYSLIILNSFCSLFQILYLLSSENEAAAEIAEAELITRVILMQIKWAKRNIHLNKLQQW